MTSLPRMMVVDPCSPSPAPAFTTVEPTRRSKRPASPAGDKAFTTVTRGLRVFVIVQVVAAVTLASEIVDPLALPALPQSIDVV